LRNSFKVVENKRFNVNRQ